MKLQKKQEKLYNRNMVSGITLIALVVTIVVLLILAGITISTLFGENGIITAARKAADDTKQDEINTEQGVSSLEEQMNNAMDSSSLMSLIKANSFVTAQQGNQIVNDRAGKTMIVPVGFRVTNDATEIDKGVVIEDKIGNQYVWVPVSNSEFDEMFGSSVNYYNETNYFGKLYNFTTTGKSSPINVAIGSNSGESEPEIITAYDGSDAPYNADFKTAISQTMTCSEFQAELQSKFNEMANSVKQYKGFYIGRYEASSLNTANPKTIKGVNPSNNINWYNIYKNMQGIEKYTNSVVQSDVVTNMIWGCQWDRTLDWIASTNTKIGYAGLKDARSWGNYYDSEKFEYTKIDGTKGTKEKGTSYSDGILIPTGSAEFTKTNNIYDLAGNLTEFTMETHYGDDRNYRGGEYSTSGTYGPPAARQFHGSSGFRSGNSVFGSRPILYVKPTAE